MKILSLVTINLITFLMGGAVHTPIEIAPTHGIYAQTMRVSEITMGTESIKDDNGTITLIDGNGNNWVDERYPEDYYVGDYVAVLLDDNGTPNYIYDDIILDLRATGFCDE